MFVVPRSVPCRFSEENYLSRLADFAPPGLQMSLRLTWTVGADGQRKRPWAGSDASFGFWNENACILWHESEFILVRLERDIYADKVVVICQPVDSDYTRLIPRRTKPCL